MSYVGSAYIMDYLEETIAIAKRVDRQAIEALVDLLVDVRWNGTAYVLGLGGSLANATHLAADLRCRARVHAWAPESLPELTARINDDGWDDVFTNWLIGQGLTNLDLVLVLSVGGGDYPPGTSVPLANALIYARSLGTPTAGIVGEPGGKCAEFADVVVAIPTVHPDRKTEHVEGWQGIIHHLIVSHPRLRRTG